MDTPARPPATVLLDLDGTLIDSAPGILGSLAAAFAELGIPLPDGGLPRTLLGPPLYRSLPPLVGADRAPEMLAAYRRIYSEVGVRECLPFDGIEALLHDLAAAGATLAVATSKAEVYANKIVEHRGWTDLFATVCGDTLDADRPTKADVVGEALRRLGNPADVIMVGDRLHDVEGARAHGLGCLGAGWGYAAPGELEEAGALAVYPDPAGLGARALHGAGTARERYVRRVGALGVDQDVKRVGASAAGSSGTSGGTAVPVITAAASADSAGAVSMPDPPCPATNQKPGMLRQGADDRGPVRDERPQPRPARHDRAQAPAG